MEGEGADPISRLPPPNQEPLKEVLGGIPGQEPFVEDEEVMDFIREHNEFEIDFVGPESLYQAHGLGERHIPVVVAMDQ